MQQAPCCWQIRRAGSQAYPSSQGLSCESKHSAVASEHNVHVCQRCRARTRHCTRRPVAQPLCANQSRQALNISLPPRFSSAGLLRPQVSAGASAPNLDDPSRIRPDVGNLLANSDHILAMLRSNWARCGPDFGHILAMLAEIGSMSANIGS